MRQVLSLFIANSFQPIPAAVYDALWIGPMPSHAARKAWFLKAWRLKRFLIYNPVTEQMEEVVSPLSVPWWIQFAAYIASPEGSCPGGCTMKMWP
jgi:hypothetical protein